MFFVVSVCYSVDRGGAVGGKGSNLFTMRRAVSILLESFLVKESSLV